VPLRYLQSGQQPVEATFVAAAAAVPNIATRAAASPTNFIFIVNSHSKGGRPVRLHHRGYGLKLAWESSPLTFKPTWRCS